MTSKSQFIAELDWQDIYTFLVSAQCDSFRAASRKLDLNPSTISRRVSRLEKRLGYKLYIEAQAGESFCELSKEGLVFLKTADAMMAAYRILKASHIDRCES
jgi:DNA-binding transcriptional LysR family regulator